LSYGTANTKLATSLFLIQQASRYKYFSFFCFSAIRGLEDKFFPTHIFGHILAGTEVLEEEADVFVL
jgi:hypothetical protein